MESAMDQNQTEKPKEIKQCLRCLKLKINGIWYTPRKAPAHTPLYKSDICPECKEHINKKKGS